MIHISKKAITSSYRNYEKQQRVTDTKTIKALKSGIWIYFLLLIFEGALRKWFLPFLATPLLIIRDPVAIWLIVTASKQKLLPSNIYLNLILTVGVLGILTGVFFGHGNLFVAFYGARVLLFHFPVIFIIGKIFNKDDILRLGRVTLIIAIPMALLTAMQFYSPQSAWVNRGIGGDMAGAGFTGALGFSRPPGTFSFTNGNSLFWGFASCFIFYFWLFTKEINKLILIGASAALLISIPLSISRGLFFQVAVTAAFTILATLRKPQYLGPLILSIFGIFIVLALLSQSSYFQTASEAFTSRFENATESEGGLEGVLIDRYLGGMVGALTNNSTIPFFGYGIGMGSNVGSMLLTGERKFLISEGEWGRLIGELGPVLGLIVVFIRLGLAMKIAMASYKNLAFSNFLPWLLLSFGLTNIPQATWAQPTSMGFSIIIGGLLIGSIKCNDNKSTDLERKRIAEKKL